MCRFYIHRLWIFDVDDSQSLRLLGGEETELDFLDLPQGRGGVREAIAGADRVVSLGHDGGEIFLSFQIYP
jgi:hypothetical protein